jgi:hypothetical protein
VVVISIFHIIAIFDETIFKRLLSAEKINRFKSNFCKYFQFSISESLSFCVTKSPSSNLIQQNSSSNVFSKLVFLDSLKIVFQYFNIPVATFFHLKPFTYNIAKIKMLRRFLFLQSCHFEIL